MTTTDEQIMTAHELAEFLKVPIATIYGWHHRQVGPPAAKVGRHLRYRREAVEQWIREQEKAPAGRER